MFANLWHKRVWKPKSKNALMDYGEVAYLIKEAVENNFLYVLWQDHVYDIHGYDLGLREKDLL